MSSWLSVGKSYKAAESVETTIPLIGTSNANNDNNLTVLAGNAKRSGASLPSPDDDHHRKKQKKHKSKKEKDKKKDRKKEKKSSKGKKDHREKPRSSTAMVSHKQQPNQHTGPIEIDMSSSDSDFSSSDDDAEFNSTRRIIRENKAEIMSGQSELTFLPNGEVLLLPKYALTDANAVTWNVDSRKDTNLLLYDNLPSDTLYTVHNGALYYRSLPHLHMASPTNTHSTHYTTTSAQQYRRNTSRPSGIVVAGKQLKIYENASQLSQLFMHRTQLLSEARRETKLHNKYRYFNTKVRSVLEDVNISRLWMRGSNNSDDKSSNSGSNTGKNASSSVGSTGNVNVMLAFPFIDSAVLSDLGYTTHSTSNTSTTSTSDTTTAYTTLSTAAQIHSNHLTRTTNTLLRTHPTDIHAILQCVYLQSDICRAQRVAGGWSYHPLHSAHTKSIQALQKSINERKISILEQSIQCNSEHNKCILYEHLVRLLVHTKQIDRVSSVLAQAVVDCTCSVSIHMLRHVYSMSVFSTSDYTSLLSSVNSVYTAVVLAAGNRAAAVEMNHALHTNNTVYSTNTTSTLQQQYQRILLERQLMQLRCDTLLHCIQVERSSGHTEKAIAIVQAVLDLNLYSGAVTNEAYSTYWDSESARLGEDFSVLPPAYMQSAVSSGSGGSSCGSIGTGYDAWVRTGRPDEPLQHNTITTNTTADNTTSITALHLRDDPVSVTAALEVCIMAEAHTGSTSTSVAGNTVYNTTRSSTTVKNTTSTTGTSTRHTTSISTTTNTTSVEDQNAQAADYFLQQMLDSTAGSGDSGEDIVYDVGGDEEPVTTIDTTNNTNDTTTDTNTTTTTNTTTEPETDMVYSRLHGYKIRVSRENTGAIYKKILTDMGTSSGSSGGGVNNSDGTTTTDTNTNTAMGSSSEPTATTLRSLCAEAKEVVFVKHTTPSYNTPLHTPYRCNAYSTYTQYRPLRAMCSADSVSVEQQPERVIFSSDIQHTLFHAVYTTHSSIIDTHMRQELKQVLVIRCLQSLGVVLYNECSHSLYSRSSEVVGQSVNSVFSAEDNILYANIMNTCTSNTTNATSNTTNINTTNSTTSNTNNTSNNNNTSTTTSNTTNTTANTTTNTTTHTNTSTDLLSQLLTTGEHVHSVCTIAPLVLRKHVVCAKLGLDSELNFTIRLIVDIIHNSSSSGVSGDSSMLSAKFIAQLRCVLVRLLTLRCLAEVSVLSSNNSDNISVTSVHALWREQCRAILQDTIPTTTTIATTTTTPTTTANTTTTTVPPAGHLGVWAAYLQGEVQLGNSGEAAKLADKVLKSLQSTTSNTTSSTSVGSVQYAGIEKFTYTVLQIALHSHNTSNSTTTTAYNNITPYYTLTSHTIHTSLSLLTQFAHRYTAFNPTFGWYSGELKPKNTKGVGKDSSGTSGTVLSKECAVGAVEILQQCVLDAASQLQEQILKDRRASVTTTNANTTGTSGGTSVGVEECSQIEVATSICDLVVLMAWIQYLSTLYTSSSVSSTNSTTTHTTLSSAVLDEAVQRGDVVFVAATSLLRGILLPSSVTDSTGDSSIANSSSTSSRFSRFFQNFVPASRVTDSTGTISNTTSIGANNSANTIATAQYLHSTLTAPSEVTVLVLLERLHTARVHWLLSTGTTANCSSNSSTAIVGTSGVRQLSYSTRLTLSSALHAALADFPLNKYVQSVFCTTNITTPGGVVHARAYYRDIAQNRQLWGGGLQASEVLNILRIEVYTANNTLLRDPLNNIHCNNVYALFDVYDVYNMCSASTNSSDSSSNTTRPIHALSPCAHWSNDSAAKVRTFLESTLSSHTVAAQMPLVWVFYIFLETSRGRNNEAKRVFFRAVSVCGWCQYLYTLCWGPLKCVFSDAELSSMCSMMEQRGLHALRGVE